MAAIIHMIVESGPGKGMTISVPPVGALLGRVSHADIPIASEAISRQHARFYFQSGRLRVTDLDSANHTLVNGSPVHDMALEKGDGIRIGDTLLRVMENASATEMRQSAAEFRRQKSSSQAIKSFILKILALPFWAALLVWWLFLAYSLMVPRVPSESAPSAANVGEARP